MAWVCVVVEVCVYTLLGYWTVLYFDLKVDWDKKRVFSKTGAVKVLLFILHSPEQLSKMFVCLFVLAFTHYEFHSFLKAVMVPSIWIGVLSLTWEIITSMFR